MYNFKIKNIQSYFIHWVHGTPAQLVKIFPLPTSSGVKGVMLSINIKKDCVNKDLIINKHLKILKIKGYAYVF